ncbi:uncharacterized protein aq_987-like [Dysidea avara]|uniref:uncharacterized protein aq_987-like n=1 Tax=Dysidea avara TaxID=196820 RepID=UPI0033193BC0
MAQSEQQGSDAPTLQSQLIINLRDISDDMVKAWQGAFKGEKYKNVKISEGDIFKGGPEADAIVSPANSFGFMDGGIDLAYSLHFGWQMQERLQEYLRKHYDGELPMGCAVIIPAYSDQLDLSTLSLDNDVNGGKPIKYLVSAPTMRVPLDVSDTVNAYLAFRCILREVLAHNATAAERKVPPINSILCPGLGTAVGCMPHEKAAMQMRIAYDAIILRTETHVLHPEHLYNCMHHHSKMVKGSDSDSEDDQ